MMNRLLTMFAAVGMVAANAQVAAQEKAIEPRHSPYWTDSQRGWHFYEDPEPDPVERRSPMTVPPKAAPQKAPELAQFEQLQKTLDEYRTIAIMQPTEANVRRYMELEAKIVGQASRFADVAQRVAWATPELDPTLHGRPVNAKALEIFEQDQRQARSRAIAALGKDHVLFFFFRSDCPYCHAFAPTLQAFQARHGITVVPVSVDGGGLPGFANPRRDNGIARTLNVTQVPALFLAQPFTGKIAPIGFGVLSESQLLERIAIVSTPSSETMAPGITRQISLQNSSD